MLTIELKVLRVQRSTLGISILAIMVSAATARAAGDESLGEGAAPHQAWIEALLDSFPAQVHQQVDGAVNRTMQEGASRRDGLAMMSCTLSLYGHNDAAAAACALFLREFAPADPASVSVAQRLAECLAPLSLSASALELTENGPVFRPQWGRLGRPPDQRLRQAIAAYEYLAGLAGNDYARAEALAMTGWVSRALGDWDSAIACWDRCASECPGTNAARNALWYAAEDLQNTHRTGEAIDRLRRFIQEYPDEVRVSAARKRMQLLEAESRRTDEYSVDPVASLAKEVAATGGAIAPWEAYVDGMRWLEREGDDPARLRLARWAAGQTGWPERVRISACMDAVSLLLTQGGDATAGRRFEAVGVLQAALESAAGPEAAPLVLLLADLHCQLDRFDTAAAVIDRLSLTQQNPVEWRAFLDAELIRTTASRGDQERARRLLATFAERNPDRPEIAQLRAIVEGK